MTPTLVDHLRSLPDDALGELLRLRPDLVVPVPADLSALAAHVESRVSVSRALDGLDQFSLQILDAARLTRDPNEGHTSVDAVLAVVAASGGDVEPARVRAVLDRLRTLCLIYGPDAALQIVAGVDEACPPYPAGLGRPAVTLDPRTAELCADPARLRRTLLSAPPAARAILDRLAAGPPVGTLAPGALRDPASRQAPVEPPEEAISPVRWLVDQGLLVPVSDSDAHRRNGIDAVELPREIGLLLRRDKGPLGPLSPEPPVTVATREPKAVDSAGAGQAMEAVRHTETLLEALAAEPAPVLRSGGVGIRELRRLARAAGLDEATSALLLEVASAAGLVGELDLPHTTTGRGGAEQQMLPTNGYDLWRGSSLARRWHHLAQAWLAMTRQPNLIGRRDDRDRLINVLSDEVERSGAPAVRRTVLGTLADLEPGAAPTVDQMLDLLTWHAPRRVKGREDLFRAALTEAALLGVTGLDALTSYGRLMLAEADPIPALDALLPTPVDHFLVQADLTVVVPGPPEPDLAAELEVITDPESTGAASVHRVTTASVRRALDAGYAADDIHALFARRSRTPVPQALTYLVDDVARKHGGLRAGSAGAYLRSDDEALLAEVLADRRLKGLQLRRLAPTVLVTPRQAGQLLAALREAGYAPVPEDPAGAAVLTRPKSRRARGRASAAGRVTDPLTAARLSTPRLLGIVEQIRQGDAAARATRRVPATLKGEHAGPVAVQAHTQALAVLQQAVRDRALVWVGYVDAHGSTTSRLVRPVSIGGGYLRAEDKRSDMLHTFALHRITAAVRDE